MQQVLKSRSRRVKGTRRIPTENIDGSVSPVCVSYFPGRAASGVRRGLSGQHRHYRDPLCLLHACTNMHRPCSLDLEGMGQDRTINPGQNLLKDIVEDNLQGHHQDWKDLQDHCNL